MADALRLDAVSVALAGRTVVHELSSSVAAGELFGILGPNGAGKTSLLKAIAGLIAYSGRVSSDGQDLNTLDAQARARAVAYVPQRSLLHAPLAVRDVVAQGRFCHTLGLKGFAAADHAAVDAAIQRLGLSNLAQAVFTELSGGEQRRVLLARALASEAPLILLDEPVASLDVAHALALFAHVRELVRAGRTAVVVLHDLNEAMTWCSSLLLLADGRCVAQGTPQQVLSVARVRDVYGVQLQHAAALGYRALEEPS